MPSDVFVGRRDAWVVGGEEIKNASEEEEDHETTYEVALEFRGHAIDVALQPDGTILEIEKEVSVSALPRAVKKTLSAQYPEAKIEKVEEVTKGEDGPVRYEVVFTIEVVLSAKGKVVDTHEEDDQNASAKVKKARKGQDDDDDEKASGKRRKSRKHEGD
jgi:anthranilate phosphoribosyltransferase